MSHSYSLPLTIRAVKAALLLRQAAALTREDLITDIYDALSDTEADWFTDLDIETAAEILNFPKPSSGTSSKSLGSFSYRTHQDVHHQTPTPSGVGKYVMELRTREKVSPFVGRRLGTYVVFLKYYGTVEYVQDKLLKRLLVANL